MRNRTEERRRQRQGDNQKQRRRRREQRAAEASRAREKRAASRRGRRRFVFHQRSGCPWPITFDFTNALVVPFAQSARHPLAQVRAAMALQRWLEHREKGRSPS